VVVVNYITFQSEKKPTGVKRKTRSVVWNVSFSGRYEMFMGDVANHVYDRLDGVEAGLDFESPPTLNSLLILQVERPVNI
jgi:hypothetical protein